MSIQEIGDRIIKMIEEREKEELKNSQEESPTPKAPEEKTKNPVSGDLLEFPVKWDEEDRAIPNAIARSALFAPIRRGNRAMHKKALIASRGDVEIRYTGEQLDMADQDVWLALVEIARRYPIGTPIEVSRYELLKALDRKIGKSGYVWLQSSIERLKTGVLWLRTKRHLVGLNMVDYFELDEKTGKYYLRMGQELVKLYANNEYALVHWENRKAIQKHVDLAKWLQGYVASHRRGEEQRIGLEKLKEWSGSKDWPSQFRASLLVALSELEKLGEIETPRIEGDVVVWKRP